MTVPPTSDEYARSPRWFWAQKALGTAADYDAIRRAVYDASMAQPWPAKGLSLANMEKERAWQIGYTHDLRWATSVPFDVWVKNHGFRCVRFWLGTVAVCVSGPSLDQVLMVTASIGELWPETRPPQPAAGR